MPKYAFTTQLSKKEPSGLTAKVKNLFWGCKLLSKHGFPTKAFHFGGGLGDHLLCTTVFHELNVRGIKGCWMLSHYPEIFQNNPYNLNIVPDDWKTLKLLEKIGRPSTLLYYGQWIGNIDKVNPPKKHIISEIIQNGEIDGEIKMRPYWYGNLSEMPIKPRRHFICVQSTQTKSSTPMLNKQWDETRMESVIDALSYKYDIVQLGTPEEARLKNTIDGTSLSISESASMLAHSEFFLGQVGFLMHLARAVNKRSVIIYGGREKAWQSGYPCNENIEVELPCSPCWQNNGCHLDRACLSMISVEQVLNTVSKLERRLPTQLETETFQGFKN